MREDPAVVNFAVLRAGGIKRVVPIAPPGVKAARFRPGSLGKVPGTLVEDTWLPLPKWTAVEATEEDIANWAQMGAGGGILCGKDQGSGWSVGAVDIDIYDPAIAAAVRDAAIAKIGSAPRRIGESPKVLLPFRYRGAFPSRLWEAAAKGPKGQRQAVEILGDGRHFVAFGGHPSGKPYEWFGSTQLDAFPAVDEAMLDELALTLATLLPGGLAASSHGSLKDRSKINQASLVGDLPLVRAAMGIIPNTDETFPDRSGYISMLAAIKAALPEEPEEAFETALEWASRWSSFRPGRGLVTNDPETVWADWRSLAAPFAVGAQLIYETAEKHSGGAFKAMPRDWFSRLDETTAEAAPAKRRSLRKIIPSRDWVNASPPPQLWVWDGWIPVGEATLLYGPGGTGKTTFMIQLAIARALGLRFLDYEIRPGKTVLCLCEDSENVLWRRVEALLARAAAAEMVDLKNLMIISLRGEEDTQISVWDRAAGRMKNTTLHKEICEEVRTFGADLVVLDTIADIFGGDEINRVQVNQFVKGSLLNMALATDAAVVALGHPSKSGMNTGDGTSGSTAWDGAARSRLYLERMELGTPAEYHRLTHKKGNLAAPGAELRMRLVGSVFELHHNASGRRVGMTSLEAIRAACEAAVLAGVAELASAGVPLSAARTSRNHAWSILPARVPTLFEGFTSTDIRGAVERLVARGALVEAVIGKDAKQRREVKGLSCAPGYAPEAPDIFS